MGQESEMTRLQARIRELEEANESLRQREQVHSTELEESLRSREAQARAQTAELQALMDAVPAAIFIAIDAECRHLSGNRRAYEFLRREPGSNLSKSAPEGEAPTNFRVMRDGVDIPPEQLPMQGVARTGQPVRNWEHQMVFDDGTCVDLLANAEPLLDDNGSPRGVVAVLSDLTERKRAEAALRESEGRFRTIADAAPVMIWMSGLDKLCTFFNKPWLDFTGRTMDQELGNGWAEGVHGEDLQRCLAIYSSSFDARSDFRMEYRLHRADGEYRWVLDSGAPLYKGGEFAGYIGSCIDITEQKLTEERLRANEIQLKDAQRLAKVGSWQRDIESGMSHWSEQKLRIFGLTKSPANFASFLAYVHPKDREKVEQTLEQAVSSATPLEVEYRIIRPDNEVRFVHSILEAIRNERGAPVRWVGATQDVTDRVEARERLRESEQRLKNAERLAHVGHWERDLRTNRVSGSEEMYRIFGKPQSSMPAYEGFLDGLIPQDRERVSQIVKESLEKKTGCSFEYQIVHPSGDLRTISCTLEVLLDDENLPVRMFGACQDITDSRRAQEEAFARQKLESVGTLASGIAHDFNNLLGSVLAQAELALSELATGVSHEEELRAIRDVAIRGAEIVSELMIYAGKEIVEVGLVDVSQIVKEMIGLLKVSVSKHATLETNLRQDLPAVQANAAQLRQIVLNLVTNASDAIGEQDGLIFVRTEHVKVDVGSGTISGSLAPGNYVLLEISDTGRGLPLEMQAKIFDPFFTTKSAGHGHGLGLAVVRGIVNDLKGAIQLTSEPGRGATFTIYLPCAETKVDVSAEVVPSIGEPGRPSQNINVLVVEDEAPLRQAVTKMLRKIGFGVLEAADGSAAIDVIHANGGKIDVILLDMTIPGASSAMVVAEAVRSQPAITVILTSAYSREMVAGAMDAFQAQRFIRKPFQLVELVQMLRNLPPRANAAGAPS